MSMVRKIITIIAVCLLLISCNNSKPNEAKLGTQQPDIKVNEEVKGTKASDEAKEPNLQKTVDVSDVTGDGNEETIIVIRKTPGGLSPISIRIMSNDGKELFMEEFGEYAAPGLFIGDFDGDGVKDIFITINTGGSRGDTLYHLLSYKNSTFADLDLNNNIGIIQHISCEVKEGYIIFNSPLIDNTVKFKLSDEDSKEYKLLYSQDQVLSTSNPVWLEPIDLDNDGVWELKCQTYFSIAYRRPIANLIMNFKYDNDKWTPIDANITQVVNN